MKISEIISARLKKSGIQFRANDNIAEHIETGEYAMLFDEVEDRVKDLLKSLVIDIENDPNTAETSRRIAKMFLGEVFAGRYNGMPKITAFPNDKELDDMLVVGNIAVRSTCSHHFAPIQGRAWVAVIPDKKIIGISKFSRLINWFATRPQIQEELAVQIADELERQIAPKGIAIVIKAQHSCMTWRGVKESNSDMTTSVMRGVFRDDAQARNEFLQIMKGDTK